MNGKRYPLVRKRFGIVGKGGAGKTTVTIFLARALRQAGYDVCLLDADSTNIGIHHALGIERVPASLIDYFGGMVFSGGKVTCPVDDPLPLPNPALDLDRLPAEFHSQSPEGIHLLIAGKIGDLGPGAGCDGPINKIARDVVIDAQEGDPVLLIDFKAGFEDSARGAITGLDWVLTVVDPTHASIQMALHMKQMVAKIKAGVPPATEHLEDPMLVELAQTLFRESNVKDVFAIINRVPDTETEAYLRSALNSENIQTLGCFPHNPAMTKAWLRGELVESSELMAKGQQIVDELERVAMKSNLKPEST
ncbi:MAG: P-loop NTPase [Anaerolineales bacterium]|jgi:CO dehydrogenase maturation factor